MVSMWGVPASIKHCSCCPTAAAVCRLSALEAVIEDGESLLLSTHTMFNKNLMERLQMVYSQTATSLALMAETVRSYGHDDAGGSGGAEDEKMFCSSLDHFGR
jgi:hypothetical protein